MKLYCNINDPSDITTYEFYQEYFDANGNWSRLIKVTELNGDWNRLINSTELSKKLGEEPFICDEQQFIST